jgi:hypothetical protein
VGYGWGIGVHSDFRFLKGFDLLKFLFFVTFFIVFFSDVKVLLFWGVKFLLF